MYFGLVAAALAVELFSPPNNETSGIWLYVVTLPWSLVIGGLLNSSHLLDNELGTFLMYFSSSMLNACCISFLLGGPFLWFRMVEGRESKG